MHLLQAAIVHEQIDDGVAPNEVELDEQLVLYNDLFGWAGIAFHALTGRSTIGMMFGPSPEGRAKGLSRG